MERPTRSRRNSVRLLASLALAATLALAACGDDDGGSSGGGGGKDPDDLQFAYLTKQGDVPYFVEQVDAAKAKAKQLGVKLTTQDLQLDTNLALSSVDTLISQGVDGIVIVVPDQSVGPAIIRKAEAADVPLIASDDIIKNTDGEPAPYVGLDNGAVGGQAGDAIAKLHAEAPWKADTAKTGVLAVELQELDVCMERTDGAKAAFLKANPDFSADQIVSVPYDGSTSKAIDAAGTAITGNSKYKHWIVWSCNDAGVQGAVRALERAGVDSDDVIGVGLDGSLACDEFKRGESGFKGTLYLDPTNEGKAGVQALFDYQTKGKALPRQLYFPGTYADRDNFGKVIRNCKA